MLYKLNAMFWVATRVLKSSTVLENCIFTLYSALCPLWFRFCCCTSWEHCFTQICRWKWKQLLHSYIWNVRKLYLHTSPEVLSFKPISAELSITCNYSCSVNNPFFVTGNLNRLHNHSITTTVGNTNSL